MTEQAKISDTIVIEIFNPIWESFGEHSYHALGMYEAVLGQAIGLAVSSKSFLGNFGNDRDSHGWYIWRGA